MESNQMVCIIFKTIDICILEVWRIYQQIRCLLENNIDFVKLDLPLHQIASAAQFILLSRPQAPMRIKQFSINQSQIILILLSRPASSTISQMAHLYSSYYFVLLLLLDVSISSRLISIIFLSYIHVHMFYGCSMLIL